MEIFDYQNAVKSVITNDYTDSDIKIIKRHLNELLKKEVSLKQKIEKETTKFIKSKNKAKNELKALHNDIKEIRNILKVLN